MPDTKITALTAITTVDPAADVLPIVDISDTSMAASGTTKKVTSNQILGAGGTATLASATITGDLTVDTSTLKVDSTNNAVGIGTASPSANTLTIGSNRFLLCSDSQSKFGDNGLINGAAADGNTQIQFFGSKSLFFNEGVSTRMTLNSTGLGVGASPSYKLHVAGTGYFSSILTLGGASRISAEGSNALNLNTNSVDRLTIDSSGNVGIGVTPSAGKGCLQLSSGINFPATQVASTDANTLDDYEEGTFTPTIVGTTSAGTGTYTTQLGRYTKVGRIVTCDISLVWTAHTGTGNIDIGGLPFSVLNTTDYAASAVIGYIDNIALTAGNIPIAVLWWFNTTKIRLNQTPTGGGAAAGVPIDTAGQINLSITYIVA